MYLATHELYDVARALKYNHSLKSLSLHLRYSTLTGHLYQLLRSVNNVLSRAPLPNLQELNLHVGYGDCHYQFDADLEDMSSYHDCRGLERQMLRLRGPRLVWTIVGQRAGTIALWRGALAKLLPTLHSQKLLFVDHYPGR